jgi:excisionase family DNA binding protein
MLVSALPTHWRARATELERFAPEAAEAFRDAADQLESTLQSKADSVTIKEAAALGGLSTDHIQRLVASGRIENVGRKGRPRIRRDDVPTKPGYAAKLRKHSTNGKVSTSAIVASVIGPG